MKHLVTILILLLLIPTSALSDAQPGDRNVVIATGEWPPLTGRELPHNGFVNHVVKEAFARQGYTVRFEFYPWTRNNYLIENGEIDASSYWYKNELREDYAIFSDVLSTEDVVLFHLKNKDLKPWSKLTELSPYRIGMVKGIYYADDFKELVEKGVLRAYYSGTEEENFHKLLRERIDIFPVAKRMGLEVLATNFTQEERTAITQDPGKISSHDGFLVFPKNKKDSEMLRNIFNAGLRELRKDGTYDRLLWNMDAGYYSAR